jgi:hypothetical protein
MLWLAAFVVAGSSGCATMEPMAAAMTPTVTAAAVTHPVPIFVTVRGGGEQWRISNKEFQKAVETALKNSQLVQSLAPQSSADYRLDVVLGSVRQPLAGGDFTTDVETIWNLFSLRSGRTVWQKVVTTSFTATTGDAFNATNRLRIATEGAARENIQRGVAELAEAPL